MARLIQRRVGQRVEHERVARVRKATDFVARRPFATLTAGCRRLVLGINAAGKQPFESIVDAGPSERLLDECVQAECRQMTLVEDDWMTQRDRTRVKRLRRDEIEQGL